MVMGGRTLENLAIHFIKIPQTCTSYALFCTRPKNVYETLQCLPKKNKSRTRMHLNGVNSQHDKETGLRNSRDPYALVNWRPPSLTSSKVFGGEGAPGRNRRLSSARPNPPPATEARPRQRLHLPPATRGRLGRFRAERRLPGEGGAQSPPSRRGARPRSPTAPSPRRARPRRASAGAWPRHTLAAGGGRGGARTSSRRRNYRASPWDRTEFISGDCLATPLGQPPGQPLQKPERRRRRTRSAELPGEPPQAAGEQRHRPPSQGPAGARAHAQGERVSGARPTGRGRASVRSGARTSARARRRSRRRAWAAGAGGAQVARARPRAREGGAGDSAELLPASAPRERPDGREGSPDAGRLPDLSDSKPS